MLFKYFLQNFPVKQRANAEEVASNNRPLSLLNAVSKICERAVLNQFKAYLMRNKLLSSQQSGNKKQHGTETLNLLITDLLLDII